MAEEHNISEADTRSQDEKENKRKPNVQPGEKHRKPYAHLDMATRHPRRHHRPPRG